VTGRNEEEQEKRKTYERTISTRSTVDWKKGHSAYMVLSSSPRPSWAASSRASPTPSHAGSSRRVWVQAKIHGMARSDSMPPCTFRLAGRLPMFRYDSSPDGVAARKYSTNRGLPRINCYHDTRHDTRHTTHTTHMTHARD
jgi:hypothetical protein